METAPTRHLSPPPPQEPRRHNNLADFLPSLPETPSAPAGVKRTQAGPAERPQAAHAPPHQVPTPTPTPTPSTPVVRGVWAAGPPPEVKVVEGTSPDSPLALGVLSQRSWSEEQAGHSPGGDDLPEWTGPGCWDHLAENQTRQPEYNGAQVGNSLFSCNGVQHNAAAADAVSFLTASYNTTASLAKQPVWSQPAPEARAADPWLPLNTSYSSMAPALPHALPPPLFSHAQPVAAQAFSSSSSLFGTHAAPPPMQPATPPPKPAPEPMDDDLRYILAQLGM
jgi:hypothetical protein